VTTIEQKLTRLLSAPAKSDNDDVQIVEQADMLLPAQVPGHDLRGQVRAISALCFPFLCVKFADRRKRPIWVISSFFFFSFFYF
jgi:hypothetical protein